MTLDEFKVATKKQLIEYGISIPLGRIKDLNGNTLTYKNYTEYWYTCTYDSRDNPLNHINSFGYWLERTYDSTGRLLVYKDSNGLDYKPIYICKKYNLLYDANSKLYQAGCKTLNYNNSKEFFITDGKNFIDAELVMSAIEENEKAINVVIK